MLATTYSPSDIEQKWYSDWEKNGYFKPTFVANAPSYSINLPPPNVTGTLHMGHGFQHTIMDALIRYHRMRGFNTLWQPGSDHAGIATQIVVERNLEAQGLTRKEIGRDEFVRKVLEWKEHSGGTIARQMRRLGASCDWSRDRFTMDEGLSQAVIEVFITLYNEGYIYRGERLVNWDVRRQTAVSDLEVKSVEEQGSIWHIRYAVVDSDESIIIATTRPETMLGDVAVAVNPQDKRYQHLIGKYLLLPLVGRQIPIIADDYVDVDFATGCVKITPAHDFNDYEIAKRHKLELINIFTLQGHINDNAPESYRGLERFAARKAIVADLDKLGALVEVKPHKLMVPRGERDDVILEPMLTQQWFCNMQEFAKTALELVANGEIEFVPENWQVIYNQWLENIQDWCISRQLWWGHRIPAYYDKQGNIYVAHSLDEASAMAGTSELKQDEDVLDTWFSSALWSFSPLGWPSPTKELATFLPSSVLVTGFDIIFFWVARMVMFTHKFTQQVPFKQVFITGLILDAHGQKMSKSKGNVIDPLDLVDGISLEELVTKRTANLLNPKAQDSVAKATRKDYPQGFAAFGADALRFAFALMSTHSREIRFDVKRIESARNFCNKVWNAARFVLMNIENSRELIGNKAELSVIDQWILSLLDKLISDTHYAYQTYRFDILAQRIYEFTWNEFCDWYLELAKVNLTSTNISVRTATVNTLLQVLETILRIMHPLMPFITEELWQEIAPLCGQKLVPSIMIADYPQAQSSNSELAKEVISDMEFFKQLCGTIRNLRAEMNVSLATKAPIEIEATDTSGTLVDKFTPYLMSLAKVSDIKRVASFTANTPIAVLEQVRIRLDVVVDNSLQRERICREIDKLTKEEEKLQVKLSNQAYLERAPQHLVERDQQILVELANKLAQYKAQLDNLS